jgi:hypothetical protein
VDPRERAEVVESFQARLRARGGREEKVDLEDTLLVLGEGERRRTVPIAELLGAWNLLPPEDRTRRIDAALARGRVPARRASEARGRLITAWLGAAVLCLLALASVTWARGEAVSAEQRRKEREAPPPPPDPSAVAATRRDTLCSAVRRRVLTGANFGPYDADGWVV